MNKELSSILKLQIASLPFLETVSGLVQTVETETFQEETNIKTIQRFPVSYDLVNPDNCGREKDLQPDSAKSSILYFEDFGSRAVEVKGGYATYVSNLRLVCWLNRKRLVGDSYAEISAYCINSLVQKLNNSPRNSGIFTRLMVQVAAIPAQNAAIFNRYTYDEKVRQYLRPPFEFFAIDLVCTYRITSSCIDEITFLNSSPCLT